MFAGDIENNPYLVERYEAKTSGGKAHALDLRPKSDASDGALWVILTDDSPPHPGVRVLEWDGWLWRGGGTRLREVAAWPRPGFYSSESAKESEPEQMAGASHAVWLD
jgi:carboxy-cis,cis-muconate cyclase